MLAVVSEMVGDDGRGRIRNVVEVVKMKDCYQKW